MSEAVSLGFKVAFNMIEAGFDPVRPTPEHFQALVEQLGKQQTDYASRQAFEHNAANWTDLAGARGYEISNFIRDHGHSYEPEIPRVVAEQAAVSGFIASGDERKAKGALDMIAATGSSSIRKLYKLIPSFDFRAIEQERPAALAKIALLKTIALEGRAADGSMAPGSVHAHANTLADQLRGELDVFKATLEARRALALTSRDSSDRRGCLITLGNQVADNPRALASVLEFLRTHATPEQRQQLIAGMLTAGSSHETQWGCFQNVLIAAKALWAIDHGSAPFAPQVGSHPLLARLFALAGQELTVQVESKPYSGRLVWLEDVDPNKEGSTAIAHLVSGNQLLSVRLPAAERVEAGGQVVFDASQEAGPKPRKMAKLNANQAEFLKQATEGYLVGDYMVNTERLVEIGDRVAALVPGGAELLDRARMENAPLYALKMISGAIVARYASAMFELDVGPAKHAELAIAAFGATQQVGYKAWAMDVQALLQQGGSAMSRAVETTKAAAYDILDRLQHGEAAERQALVRGGLANMADKLKKTQDRGVKLSPGLFEAMVSFFGNSARAV